MPRLSGGGLAAPRADAGAPPPPPTHPLRTNRTRRVLHPVLIGHAGEQAVRGRGARGGVAARGALPRLCARLQRPVVGNERRQGDAQPPRGGQGGRGGRGATEPASGLSLSSLLLLLLLFASVGVTAGLSVLRRGVGCQATPVSARRVLEAQAYLLFYSRSHSA